MLARANGFESKVYLAMHLQQVGAFKRLEPKEVIIIIAIIPKLH